MKKDDEVLKIINEIINEKRGKVIPDHAMLKDVSMKISLTIKETHDIALNLSRRGVIEIKNTINSYAYILTDEKK